MASRQRLVWPTHPHLVLAVSGRAVTLAALSLSLSLGTPATVTANIAPAAVSGGSFSATLQNLLGRFPFLTSLLQGASISLHRLQELFPFLDGVPTGALGLPDLEELDAMIAGREPGIDDIFFGPGSTLPTGEVGDFFRAKARAEAARGLASSFLSLTGQDAAAESLQEVAAMENAIVQGALAISTLADEGTAADTSFDRLGALIEQRRQAALQAQADAGMTEELIGTLQQQAALQASQLELTAQVLQAQTAERIRQQRRENGTSTLLRTARTSAFVFGGDPATF